MTPQRPTDETVSISIEAALNSAYSFVVTPVSEDHQLGPQVIFKVDLVFESDCGPPVICDAVHLEEIHADYSFPASVVEGVVVFRCPAEGVGEATWECGPHGWIDLPDLSGCSNPDLQPGIFLDPLDETAISATATVNELNRVVVEEVKTLLAGDLQNVVTILNGTLLHLRAEIAENPELKHAVSYATAIAEVIDTLLAEDAAWATMSTPSRKSFASQMQNEVENAGFVVAGVMDAFNLANGTSISISVESILVTMMTRRAAAFSDLTFNYKSAGNMTIYKPALEAVLESQHAAFSGLSIVFVGYDNLHCVLKQSIQPDCFKKPPVATPVRTGGYLANFGAIQDFVIPSKVIGATVGSPLAHYRFEDYYVEVFFNTSSDDPVEEGQLECVYWNDVEHQWQTDGCLTTRFTGWIKCQCRHLTNFAVLLDMHGLSDKLTGTINSVMKFATIFCSVISLASLLATMIIFGTVRGTKNERTVVHMNLCFCLFVAQMILLAGLDATGNRSLCAGIAISLHFFFTAAWGWMLVEGIVLYLLLHKVFTFQTATRGLLAHWVCYGSAGIIVTITALVTEGNAYGSGAYCWLAPEYIWTFAGPIAVILLANLVILILSLRAAYHSRNFLTGNVKKEKKKKSTKDATVLDRKVSRKMSTMPQASSTTTWIKGSISMTCLLGLTWIIGFIYRVTQKSS